ncbi:hypothetical protein DW920_13805 [Clostridium sp. AM42-36]|jgi:hypothetical protein|nr:hypothetical protein DW920_13805 [Clostridium sp. AM42-36]RHU81939.1 hypothetical protein DXC24_14765 [Clostridium sp. OM08-29]
MALLNYSTTVDAYKTVAEIEQMLVRHGAKSIMKSYEGEDVTSLSFLIDTGNGNIPVKLPVRLDDVLQVLTEQKKAYPKANIKATREQANRVAWRILKDWIEVQMALLDMQMVKFEEIFLSYIETADGKTVYEKLEEKHFLLNR